MEILLHIGAHSTDNDQILRCFLRNRASLERYGTIIALPRRYRPIIRETLQLLDGTQPNLEIQETVLDGILDSDHARRVFMSHDSFICVPGNAIRRNMFYPMAQSKLMRLRNLFAHHEVRFAVALCNPATYIPTLFERAQESDFAAFLEKTDPLKLRWSNFIERALAAVPDAKMTIWCNEDTPLIWPRLLQNLSGHPPDLTLEGANDFLSTVLGHGGKLRFERYIAAHPPKDEAHWQRILSAFLEDHADERNLEQEINLPGWAPEYVEKLSALYEADLELIASHSAPNIEFLSP